MVSFVQLAQVFFVQLAQVFVLLQLAQVSSEQFLPVSSVELVEVFSVQLALRFSVVVWKLVLPLVVIFLCSCQVSGAWSCPLEMLPLYLDPGFC